MTVEEWPSASTKVDCSPRTALRLQDRFARSTDTAGRLAFPRRRRPPLDLRQHRPAPERPPAQPARSTLLNSGAFASSTPPAARYASTASSAPWSRHVVPLPTLLVQPQPAPQFLPGSPPPVAERPDRHQSLLGLAMWEARDAPRRPRPSNRAPRGGASAVVSVPGLSAAERAPASHSARGRRRQGDRVRSTASRGYRQHSCADTR